MNEHEWMAYNRQLIEEFRTHEGVVQGWAPLILLTTKGARSSQTRIYPLMAIPDGDHYIAVASAGGAPKNPQWYYNLLAYPDVTIEVGRETLQATARLLTGKQREEAFAKAVAVFAPYGEYQQNTTREIPVFLLERQTGT